jgi:FixJ family two-component response regulator
MNEKAIVHVVEDDESMRAALDSPFRSAGFETRLYGAAPESLSRAPEDAPGLVVDVRLPGMSGFDFQERLAGAGVRLPVVLMTGHGDIPMSVRGMKAGAVDFLTKPFRDQDMLDAVAQAVARDRKQRTEESRIEALKAQFETLSPRERQVMALVAAGRMNKQVAGRRFRTRPCGCATMEPMGSSSIQ